MSQWVSQSTPDGSSIWLPGIVACIANHLPANEVASTLRQIDKATSDQLAHHKTLRLSLPSPIHVFRERWGRPGAFRALSRKQRFQLLCLTAASGSVANLEIALANAGLDLRCELLEAAAAAGQLGMCKVLGARGCPWGDSLSAAAKAGHRHVCEWLLASGCPFHWNVVCSAARGGREDLLQWLLTELQDRPNVSVCDSLLRAAAESLSLAALQRLWQQLMAGRHGSELQQQLEQLDEEDRDLIMVAAAGSTTPDWQAKVEWLEGLGYPRTARACEFAVRAGDGDAVVARLQWLRGRGYPLEAEVADAAVFFGNLAALRFLVEQAGVRPTGDESDVTEAARQGHLAVLQYLHASGLPVHARLVAGDAARAGHLPLVAWAVESLGVAPADGAAWLLDCAAASGNLELMAWLHDRGWALGPKAFPNGAESGCEEALEWLVERGCPFPLDGGAYFKAAFNGDLAMLRCLHRLGCPWGPTGKLLADCISIVDSVAVLQCLLDLGCPEPDWDAAVRRAQRTFRERHAALLAWLREQRRRRRSSGPQGA
ncbi:hypothetical protein PLESTB_000323200 [Pleodorina starrii]|uniref:Ankyrin repeat domain-containing protein n=1 Tax=Pleodorina starrii TaxID=330485 RepID=A0A9W6EZA8_9CHLO|nr:hypothetical protein PLESTM_000889800 [Pleodorina starrii]GLC40408.1 hypothetical protein PLESTM_001059500 [Pleodorina starrii]GLC49921.1 hypothetical protein PLESTB_000323200 [Pleodorina starrii]GLC68207.1 hypothetical protein PLESTF_000662000 [Pleodorina starrii]